jgi:4-amino-4-deoxy-L-arabinose transferase-like glycosyltransferase
LQERDKRQWSEPERAQGAAESATRGRGQESASCVQIPGARITRFTEKRSAIFVGIIALAATLTLHRLGAPDVCGFNEAVEGVFVQQMVEHDAYLFPLDNARAPLYKPPLFHWTATALDRLAGVTRVTAFNLRLPSALYAIAGVALTIAFAADFLGFNGAILAGLILCGSYQYIEQGRLGRVDMALCFYETLALFAFTWWLAPRDPPPRREGLRYLFALALGLAVLAKGPVGAILPATACGLLILIERRFDALRRLATPGPVLLAILVGSSWYAACYFSGRHEFLHRQLGSENFGRFFGALGAMAPGYYLTPLLLNSAPFSLLVPIAVFYALRTFWTAPSANASRPDPDESGASPRETDPRESDADQSQPDIPRQDIRMRSAIRLFAIFWIVTVLFFSVAAYKRRAYLLPLWPPSAVLLAALGGAQRSRAEGAAESATRGQGQSAPKSATRGQGQESASCVEIKSGEAERSPGEADAPHSDTAPGDAASAAASIRDATRGLKLTRERIIRLSVITIALGSSVFNFFYLPRHAIRECGGDSFRETAAQIDRIVGRDEPLYSYKLGDEPAALLFYLDRDAPPLDGRLGDAPPGYLLTPAAVWRAERATALDLTPVFESTSGAQRLVLLRHGPALANAREGSAQAPGTED